MKNDNFFTSACRYCRSYQPEGRRGGYCNQLNVPVQPGWKSCALATHPFSAPWEKVEEVVLRETTVSANYDSEKTLLEPVAA